MACTVQAIRSSVAVAIFALAGLRCSKPTSAPDILTKAQIESSSWNAPLLNAENDGVISSWLAIGPFKPTGQIDGFDVDFFSEDQSPELSQSMMRAKAWATNSVSRHKLLHVESADRGMLRLKSRSGEAAEPTSDTAAIYLVARLKATTQLTTYLRIGSDDGFKVWLNSRLLAQSRAVRPLRADSDLVRLDLTVGDNEIIVKVVNFGGNWGVSAALSRSATDSALTVLRSYVGGGQHLSFLEDSRFVSGERLRLKPGVWPNNFRVRARLQSIDGDVSEAVQFTGREAEPLSIPDGIYRLVFGADRATVSSILLVGDDSHIRPILTNRFQRDSRLWPTVYVLLQRIDICRDFLKRQAPGTQNHRSAQKRLAEASEQLAAFVAAYEDGRDPLRDLRGVMIRGFRSAVDNQILPYRIFISPSAASDEKQAMVICPATVTERDIPFSESPSLRDPGISYFTERVGGIIVWPGYHCQQYGSPIDFAHLDEVMAHVRANTLFDESRLVLLGTSSGAIIAALEAHRHPTMYAGVIIENGVLHRKSHRYRPGAFDFFDGYEHCARRYREYMQDHDPFSALLDTDVPTYLVNFADPTKDSFHASLVHVQEDFVRAATGIRRMYQPTSYVLPGLPWAETVERIASCVNAITKTPTLRANGIERSAADGVSSVLCHKFAVIEGTIGSERERQWTKKVASEFAQQWRKTAYGVCNVVSDSSWSEKDEQDCNLVLIGNQDTNAVWRRLAPRIPVGISRGSIRIREKTWRGKSLSIQAVVAHPDHPAQQILLLGAPDLGLASFGTLDLAIDGWFEYAIWRNDASYIELLDAGYKGSGLVTVRSTAIDETKL